MNTSSSWFMRLAFFIKHRSITNKMAVIFFVFGFVFGFYLIFLHFL